MPRELMEVESWGSAPRQNFPDGTLATTKTSSVLNESNLIAISDWLSATSELGSLNLPQKATLGYPLSGNPCFKFYCNKLSQILLSLVRRRFGFQRHIFFTLIHIPLLGFGSSNMLSENCEDYLDISLTAASY
jgi:hypothetical protein